MVAGVTVVLLLQVVPGSGQTWAWAGRANLAAITSAWTEPRAAAPPAGDDCGDAVPIGEGTYYADTSAATSDGTASCGDSAGSPDVWFTLGKALSCLVQIDTCGSGYDTVLSIHTGCPGTTANEIACNDDFDCDGDGSVSDDGYVSGVTFQAEVGQVYYIRVAGWQGATGPVTLNLTCQETVQADDCVDAVEIGEGVQIGDTRTATNDGAASCGDSASSADVWFRYTPVEDCQIQIDTCGSMYDTVLSIHDACPGTIENQIACNDDVCGVQSSVTASLLGGTSYFIRVAGWQGATGAFVLHLSCSAPGPPGADVLIGELNTLQQYGRLGDVVGCALDSPVCNAGTEPLDWYGNPDPRHPFMVYNMYRLKAGRFAQIGQSWIKHGFASAQADACGLGCLPWPDSTRTGVGCSDTYSAALNALQLGLGPRYEVNPWTGAYTFQGSHLDGHSGGHDPIEHRLQIHDADLDPAVNPGASYYCELYVLAHDDVDHMNSAGWEPVVVSGTPGGTWSFDIGGSSTFIGPAIEAWAGALRTVIPEAPVDDGRVILAVQVTDNGNGTWHYEYALYNHDLDRAVGSLSLPLSPSVHLTNLGFRAVESHDEPYTNDPWQWTVTPANVTWATEPYDVNPNANPIRWGTLYNFWFDSDAAPVTTTATIGLFSPGTPTVLAGPTQGPAAPCPPDLDGSGVVDVLDLLQMLAAWGSCTQCAEDLNDDGLVDVLDLLALLAAWGPCA